MQADKVDISDSLRFYTYNEISVLYSLNNPRKSREYAYKAYEVSQLMRDALTQGIALRQIGAMSLRLDEITHALDYHLQALALFKQINNEYKSAEVLLEIGVDYVRLEKYDKALSFMHEAKEIFSKINKNTSFSTCLNNIGGVHYYLEQYDSTLFYYQSCIDLALKINDKKNLSYAYHNIGEIYFIQENYKKAKDYVLKSLLLKRELGNKSMIPSILITFSKIEIKLNKLQSAYNLLTEALIVSREIESKSFIRDSYEQLAIVEEKRGNYIEALIFQKKLLNIENEINEDTKNEYVSNLQVEFETEKVENENALLKEKAAFQQKLIHKQKFVNISIITILLLVIGIAWQFIYNYNKQKSKNITLHKKNNIVKHQSNKLKKLSKFKDEITGMIFHDLKNPMSIIIGATSFLSEDLPQRKIIFEAAKRIENMTLDMLDIQRHEDATMNLNKTNNVIFDIAENAIKLTEHLFNKKNIVIVNKIHTDLLLNVDKQVIERVFENLLTNAIKFSLNNKTITLNYKIKEERLLLSVSNQGLYIPDEYKEMIFDRFTQIGTESKLYQGASGLGLRFCKLAIDSHGGKIWVNSEYEKVTTFYFSLPYNNGIPIMEDDFIGKVWEPRIIDLSEEDKASISSCIKRLKELEVFEASEIKAELLKININNRKQLKEWTEQIMNTVITCNHEEYKKLINIK